METSNKQITVYQKCIIKSGQLYIKSCNVSWNVPDLTPRVDQAYVFENDLKAKAYLSKVVNLFPDPEILPVKE